MTEDTLKDLDLDGLLELMLVCTKELSETIDKKDEIGMRIKKKQLDLLHRLIIEKKEQLIRH